VHFLSIKVVFAIATLLAAMPAAAAADTSQPTTHAYRQIPEIPVELTSLDVYPAGSQSRAPVVIFVHGTGPGASGVFPARGHGPGGHQLSAHRP
jgi:predicted dienelactone hydrolase